MSPKEQELLPAIVSAPMMMACVGSESVVGDLTVKFFKKFQIRFQKISLHVSGQCLQIKEDIVHGNQSARKHVTVFGNTLAATILVSVINLINLAKCDSSGKAAAMSVASLAECVA